MIKCFKFLILSSISLLFSCKNSSITYSNSYEASNSTDSSNAEIVTTDPTSNEKEIISFTEKEEKMLRLKINDQEVDVSWQDNPSVDELKQLAKNDLQISMHRYGGFEQVGSLGQSIISSDKRITTSPGDIVLYDSENIVIFYGSNTWEYTRLGHINLDETQLSSLLGNEDVSIFLSTK